MPPFRRVPSLALAAGVMAGFFLSGGICALSRGFAQTSAQPGAVQKLDVRQGYWEVRMHASATGVMKPASREGLEKLYGQFSPEQREEAIAAYRATEREEAEKFAKGGDNKHAFCPLNQDFESSNQISNPSNCSKQIIRSTGQELTLRITCQPSDAASRSEQTNHFERIDPQNFKGTVEVINGGGGPTVNQTFTAKWLGDSCANPPAVAGRPGVKPKGPTAVSEQDPNRVVAVIDGIQITARQGWNLMKKVPPSTRSNYDSRQPELLQQVYMQNVIAGEAVKLHLDRQSPWKGELEYARMQLFQTRQNYPTDPNIPPELMAAWEDARVHILWKAYFSQGATKEDNDALLKREREKYKIQVRDSDFFSSVAHP
jgi:hypothetical protein